jgi:hypothetical protein
VDTDWRPFVVDGVTYYWRTYAGGMGNRGMVMVEIAPAPADRASFGMVHPGGTVATERHAVEALRYYVEVKGHFP